MNNTLAIVAAILALVLAAILIALWKMPVLRMTAQSLLPPREASPAVVLAELDRYRQRRVCFQGKVAKVVAFSAPSPDDPLSYLFEGMSGSLELQVEGDAIVDVLLQTKPDAASAGEAAMPAVGTTIEVCGFASESPASAAGGSRRLLLVGHIEAGDIAP
ncbi:hypothetical protein LDO31_15100 [Luteimonas sp. XNQY3]|nr:hypothetical protein [Luteimonas sp. XNQY3]MCD9007541.1 hypothetical protein [Luteimonas sp. XNQY3]